MFIEETSAYLVNPGSVGQPRDHDPRAGVRLYDSDAKTVALPSRRLRHFVNGPEDLRRGLA